MAIGIQDSLMIKMNITVRVVSSLTMGITMEESGKMENIMEEGIIKDKM